MQILRYSCFKLFVDLVTAENEILVYYTFLNMAEFSQLHNAKQMHNLSCFMKIKDQ